MKRMTNFWAFIKKLAGLIGFTGDKIEIGNDLEVDGKLKAFENITDANDNLRFVEGEIATKSLSNVTFSYNKWSLSGTHLMIVLAGKINASSILGTTEFATLNLPSWITNKITKGFGSGVVDLVSSLTDTSTPFAKTDGRFQLLKNNDNTLSIYIVGHQSTTNEQYFRCQFDLIIDNAN